MAASLEKRIQEIGTRLVKEALDNPVPSHETCRDLLNELGSDSSNSGHFGLSVLENTKIGKLLTKAVRSFRRHERTSQGEIQKEWTNLVHDASKLLDEWKTRAENEAKKKRSITKNKDSAATAASSIEPGLPKSVAEYRLRLVVQKKEIYKDPPALPPVPVTIYPKTCPLPKRDTDTGMLTFTAYELECKSLLKDFKPNLTPEEILRAGSFGGTYFRPITSAVTNMSYKSKDVLNDTVPTAWIKGLSMDWLTSTTYRPQINKYGVQCGGSLGMWESSGWIVESDPYGWFQWYCRFYQGRRCSDDPRQVSRWLKSAGPKGRFRSQLCNKILASGAAHNDRTISPVIRQTLLHWGLDITPSVLQAHRKRTGR